MNLFSVDCKIDTNVCTTSCDLDLYILVRYTVFASFCASASYCLCSFKELIVVESITAFHKVFQALIVQGK